MKTNLTPKSIMMFALATVIMVSCSKESNTLSSGSVNSYDQPPVSGNGTIIDYGFVINDTKLMKADLPAQDFTLYGTDNMVSGSAARVEAAFYVNDDGFIPAGEYTFSTSDVKMPFTFDSGVFSQNLNDPNGPQADQIVGGTINVNRDGDKYVFAFKVDLASGLTLTDGYNVTMAYADSK